MAGSSAKTIILYHGNCPDGFGGAYAAWKKFGDAAEYIALHRDAPVPAGAEIANNTLYFVDFCYDKPTMDAIAAEAASMTVLDHHEGVKDVIESMPQHIYDATRSGATIAWTYFHPDAPVPAFLKIVEQADLHNPLSDDDRALMTYAYAQPYTFEVWDALVKKTEDPSGRAALIERGRAYAEYFALVAGQLAARAMLVSFEGHEVYFVEAPRIFTTEVGSLLYEKKPPFTLIAHARADGMRISMRADKSIDVSTIARKYGGNGHPGAAAFSLPWGAPLPWKPLEELNS